MTWVIALTRMLTIMLPLWQIDTALGSSAAKNEDLPEMVQKPLCNLGGKKSGSAQVNHRMELAKFVL